MSLPNRRMIFANVYFSSHGNKYYSQREFGEIHFYYLFLVQLLWRFWRFGESYELWNAKPRRRDVLQLGYDHKWNISILHIFCEILERRVRWEWGMAHGVIPWTERNIIKISRKLKHKTCMPLRRSCKLTFNLKSLGFGYNRQYLVVYNL